MSRWGSEVATGGVTLPAIGGEEGLQPDARMTDPRMASCPVFIVNNLATSLSLIFILLLSQPADHFKLANG